MSAGLVIALVDNAGLSVVFVPSLAFAAIRARVFRRIANTVSAS